MKKTLLTIAVAALTVSSFAQGTLNVLNSVPGVFRAPIYGPEPTESHIQLSGQSSLGIPSGTTPYGGSPLQGSNFTFAVYYGPLGYNPYDLILLTTTTFRTASGNALPAGLIYPQPNVVVPGIPAGGTAMLQVRVWYNEGGLINSWATASTKGASAMFSSQPLGGGIVFAPDMTGWTSFNISGAPIPEPRMFVFAGLGAAALLIFRQRK